MIKAQALGALDAAREGPHQRTIAGLYPVDERPGDRLARQAPRQAVELAMGIHHDEVKAVLIAPAGRPSDGRYPPP